MMFLPSLGFCIVTHSLSITYNNVGCEVASFLSGIREIEIVFNIINSFNPPRKS
jgi:hypothetical protein